MIASHLRVLLDVTGLCEFVIVFLRGEGWSIEEVDGMPELEADALQVEV